MSYANGTQFYNLPQTVGTDKRDWFDTNQAFAAVDAALHAAASGQAADAEAIATINGKLLDDESAITSLQGSVSTHASQITTLANSVNQLNTEVADVRADAEDMICAYNEGAAAASTRAYEVGDYFIYNDVLYKATLAIDIGDTIVPNTNCEASNVTSEIIVINEDIDDIKSDLSAISKFGHISIPISTHTTDQYGSIGIDLTNELPDGAIIVAATQLYQSYIATENVLPLVCITTNKKGIGFFGFTANINVSVGAEIIYKLN